MSAVWFEARTPRGSDWDALVAWLRTDAPVLDGVAREPETLARYFLQNCCLPASADVVEDRVAMLLGPGWSLNVPASRDALFAALDGWSIRSDPDHAELADLLTDAERHLAVSPVDPSRPDELRGWLRWSWMRGAGVWSDEVSDELRDALDAWAFATPHPESGRTAWVPRSREPSTPLRADRVDAIVDAASRGPHVVGICGAAASGKSSLAGSLRMTADAEGLECVVIHGDAHTWPGEGVRYVHEGGRRRTLLHGAGIYDRRSMAAAVKAARDGLNGRGLVVVESVFTPVYPEVAALLDDCMLLHIPDSERLARKLDRDTGDPNRRIDIVVDFARKQYDEVLDVLDAGLCDPTR